MPSEDRGWEGVKGRGGRQEEDGGGREGGRERNGVGVSCRHPCRTQQLPLGTPLHKPTIRDPRN